MCPARLHARSALFLDVDGTLIDIASNPEAVVVPGALVRDLCTLERQLDGALALISGRTIADLDRLFDPLRLKASGVHGAEFRFEPDQAQAEVIAFPLPSDLWDALAAALDDFPGTFAENKAFSFAVHYRAAPGSGEPLRRRLEALAASRPELGLVLMPGHYVFELKRPDINKGAAIARFMEEERFRGRQPVFLGDDVTDRPGFDTVTEREGLAYSVSFAAPGVAGTFADPSAVREWLARCVDPKGPEA